MRAILMLSLCLCVWAAGCDVISNNPGNEQLPKPGLKAFKSAAEFEAYVAERVTEANTYEVTLRDGEWAADDADVTLDEAVPGDAIGDGGASNGGAQETPIAAPDDPSGTANGEGDDLDSDVDHSDTTIQEAGVDEADVVKTDGQYLYLVSDNMLRIVAIGPGDALTQVSETALPGWTRDLYLYGDTVVALSEEWGAVYELTPDMMNALWDAVATETVTGGDDDSDQGSSEGSSEGSEGTPVRADDEDEPAPPTDPDGEDVETPGFDPGEAVDIEELIGEPMFEPRLNGPQTVVTVLNVADRSAPAAVMSTAFEGTTASSRMIDGRLHLVLANSPYYFYPVMPRFGEDGFAVEELDVERMVPRFTQVDADGEVVSGPLLTWESLYRPDEPDGFGTTVVVSMDVNDPAHFDSVGVVADPALVYSSLDALYVTDTEWDWEGANRTSTSIYKFAYTDGAAVPVAAGAVPGRVLNQYSMSEYQDHLRVATTVDAQWFWSGEVTESYNNVYVLGEVDDELSIVGRVEELAPGETIQSARFLGDRGFVVTFEQIDPLFTLDLSNPAAPQVLGELKVPGFSTFMVPLDQDHLLTIGEYVPEDGSWWFSAVQISIFDVSDMANPVQSHNLILGSETVESWSDALWDPKALTLYQPADGPAILALPLSETDVSDWWFLDVDDGVAVIDEDGNETEPNREEGEDTTEPGDAGEPDEPAVPGVSEYFQGLALYEVSAAGGIVEIGRLATVDPDNWLSYPSYTRGVFVEDRVLAVTDRQIVQATLADPGQPVSELALPEPVWMSEFSQLVGGYVTELLPVE